MKENRRNSILERDGFQCRNCGSGKDLEVHHIVTREECEWLDWESPEATKSIYDHPDNQITLCRVCHSLTLPSPPKRIFSIEEKNEWDMLWEERNRLSTARDNLKNAYFGIGDVRVFRSRKQRVDLDLKKIHDRAEDLRGIGEQRKEERQKEVFALCPFMPNR